MRPSINFLVRIVGMFALAYVGLLIGRNFSGSNPNETQLRAITLLALAGAGLGLLTTPRWTIDLLAYGLRYVRSISITELTAIVFGALVGLVFNVLLSPPLSQLPNPFGQIMPIIMAGVLAYLGALIFSLRRKEFADLLRSSRGSPITLPNIGMDAIQQRRYLIDTSAIIDGRIANVLPTGFLDGTLLVPAFVLNELQLLADSTDELRRGRGKRGLDMLNSMQRQAAVEVLNVEIAGVQAVDDKLIVLARQYRCPIITNDHNLGRVAELQGVTVLNLNQLADAVRPPVMPGQDLVVRVRDVGREREQGISFLDDGTMIVIEEAKNLVGQDVTVNVTRVFQTQTGRIVFAQLVSTALELARSEAVQQR